MTRSGRFILKGKGDEPLLQLRARIRAEELAHSRVFREPFSIHSEVSERMEKADG